MQEDLETIASTSALVPKPDSVRALEKESLYTRCKTELCLATLTIDQQKIFDPRAGKVTPKRILREIMSYTYESTLIGGIFGTGMSMLGFFQGGNPNYLGMYGVAICLSAALLGVEKLRGSKTLYGAHQFPSIPPRTLPAKYEVNT